MVRTNQPCRSGVGILGGTNQDSPLFSASRLSLLLLLVFLGQLLGPRQVAAAVHIGSGDVSTGVALDENYMFVGDDETQLLSLYARYKDGPPLWRHDFSGNLALNDRDENGAFREADIEASVRVGNRIYWLGSHSNCGGCGSIGEPRPNRNRLFATDIIGTGTNATLRYVGRYNALKRDLIAWDNTNGHGLGPKALRLELSAATGVAPENTNRSGFNLEGLCLSPDGQMAYLGFRAPLTPMSGRSNALIVPLLNLTELVQGNPARGPAQFGPPIELDLGLRGIRSLDSNSNGVVIIAGPATDIGTFCIYTWTGRTNDPPRERFIHLTLPGPEGLILDDAFAPGTRFQLLSEGGINSYSEVVKMGSEIPFIDGIRWVNPGLLQLSILGRNGTDYDVEAAGEDGTWQWVARVQAPLGGMATWVDPRTPSAASFRVYRVRYPARP
jgi:hypothetical protein